MLSIQRLYQSSKVCIGLRLSFVRTSQKCLDGVQTRPDRHLLKTLTKIPEFREDFFFQKLLRLNNWKTFLTTGEIFYLQKRRLRRVSASSPRSLCWLFWASPRLLLTSSSCSRERKEKAWATKFLQKLGPKSPALRSTKTRAYHHRSLKLLRLLFETNFWREERKVRYVTTQPISQRKCDKKQLIESCVQMSKIFSHLYEETRHWKPWFIKAIMIVIRIQYVMRSFHIEYTQFLYEIPQK